MKKYVKPDLFYENFELSQSVAAGCKVTGSALSDANFRNGNDCEYNYGLMFFNETNRDCVANYNEFDERFCYQTGEEGFRFFAS